MTTCLNTSLSHLGEMIRAVLSETVGQSVLMADLIFNV